MTEKGFQLVTVQSDLGFLAKEAANVVKSVKSKSVKDNAIKGSADTQTSSPY
jgi:hypothetical protein